MPNWAKNKYIEIPLEDIPYMKPQVITDFD